MTTQTIYKCQKCEMIFYKAVNVRSHLHLVHEERTIKCQRCMTLFSYNYILKKHMKVCNGVKKVKRQIPQQRLKNVEFHVTEDSNSENSYKCNKCEKIFRNAQLIRSHIIQKHREKKYECELCHKLFPFNSTLNYHKKNNHGVAGLKDTTEAKNIKYITNVDNLSHKLYQCQQCEKRFGRISLKRTL